MAKPKLALIPAAQGDKFYSVLPSDGVGDFDFTRNSSATRIAPTGFIQTVGAFGSELVTNGNFDNDSDWSKETGWTISGGKASYNGSASNNALYQTISVTSGKIYKLTFTVVNYVSGTLIGNISTGATAGGTGNITANGDYSFNITASGALCIFRSTSSFNGSIDNISVVEVVGNKSRLNYDLLNGKVVNCPHYLLEPASTNLLTYSEDFSQSAWTKSNTTITSNSVISPDGSLNASKLIPNTANGIHKIGRVLSSVSGDYTFSIFAKKGEYKNILLWDDELSEGIGVNLDDLSVFRNVGNEGYNIENYGNGWVRISVTLNYSAQVMRYALYIYDNSATPQISFAGNGVDGFYIFGAQVEEQSYPTSYIPTNGTAITRAAETATGSGDAATFNDSEGVLMIETAALANDLSFRLISINDGSTNNTIKIGYRTTSQAIYYEVRSGGVSQAFQIYTTTDITLFHKTAVLYKENDFKLFIDGFNVLSDTSGITPIGINQCDFNDGVSSPFYGKTRELQYFDSVLTDAQLETLTSWTSLQEMITSQLYTNY